MSVPYNDAEDDWGVTLHLIGGHSWASPAPAFDHDTCDNRSHSHKPEAFITHTLTTTAAVISQDGLLKRWSASIKNPKSKKKREMSGNKKWVFFHRQIHRETVGIKESLVFFFWHHLSFLFSQMSFDAVKLNPNLYV